MSWQAPEARRGWRRAAEEAATRITYTLRTIMEVVAGGAIRYGKRTWDDTTPGFWLGVDAVPGGAWPGVPRFHAGGPDHALLWDGARLSVTGAFRTPTTTIDDDGIAIRAGSDGPNWLRFVDAGGSTVAWLSTTAEGGPWLSLSTPRPDMDGETNYMDLFADGDLGESVRLRLYNKRGTPGSARLEIQVGGITVARFTAAGLDLPSGWDGIFRTDEVATVTVANGIITNVA